MIQTQLLRLDPPYQIISAGGQVGIQLATLIVTEDKQDFDGGYAIDTHSHPVVSYGLKEGLENELNYGGCHPLEEYKRNSRMQPEGAVWNKVEINDIRVLGLAGAKNRAVSLETFMSLVPGSTKFSPFQKVWDEKSLAKMYDLVFRFSHVGLYCEKKQWLAFSPYENKRSMYLEINVSDDNTPLVHVVMVGEDRYDACFGGEIGFWFHLYEKGSNSIEGCVRGIVYAFHIIESHFIKDRIEDKFGYSLSGQDPEFDSVLIQLQERVNQELDR